MKAGPAQRQKQERGGWRIEDADLQEFLAETARGRGCNGLRIGLLIEARLIEVLAAGCDLAGQPESEVIPFARVVKIAMDLPPMGHAEPRDHDEQEGHMSLPGRAMQFLPQGERHKHQRNEQQRQPPR